jgi:hypothetical protein
LTRTEKRLMRLFVRVFFQPAYERWVGAQVTALAAHIHD